jgi:hypothetical protein
MLDTNSYYDYFFWNWATWEYKFCLVPRKCAFSKKRIWFKSAYRAERIITGPGTPIFEYRWVDKNEFLIQRLKGII